MLSLACLFSVLSTQITFSWSLWEDSEVLLGVGLVLDSWALAPESIKRAHALC